MASINGSLVRTIKINEKKIFKNPLLQNHLAQIWYVALPNNVLPNLFKSRSQGPRFSVTGVLGSNHRST